MPIECTSCQSGNTQKISMVYESGISSIDGKSTSTGVGLVRSGLGVGVSRSKIKGTQQTALSKKAAPPLKKNLVRNVAFYFVGLFLIPSFVNSIFPC